MRSGGSRGAYRQPRSDRLGPIIASNLFSNAAVMSVIEESSLVLMRRSGRYSDHPYDLIELCALDSGRVFWTAPSSRNHKRRAGDARASGDYRACSQNAHTFGRNTIASRVATVIVGSKYAKTRQR
jgi:hypothetical protein